MHANATLLCQVFAVLACMSTTAHLLFSIQFASTQSSTLRTQGSILSNVSPVDSFVKVALLELLL